LEQGTQTGGAQLNVGDCIPLTDAQAEKWLGTRYAVQAGQAFGESVELVLDGPLRAQALVRAFETIVARHQVLAMAFTEDGLHQRYQPPCLARLECVDLSDTPDPEPAWLQQRTVRMLAPFDPARPPLLRATLFVFSPHHARLLLVAHHLILDGWSLRLTLQELSAEYALLVGQAMRPPLPAMPWADYVARERGIRDGAEGRRCLTYWQSVFADLPEPLRLPTDAPRAAELGFRSGHVQLELAAERWDALRGAARRAGTTRFSLLLSAYCVLMHRLSGQTDLVCGVPFAGAAASGGHARVVGDTDNTLPLRIRLDPAQPLQALVAQVHQTMQEAAAHQHISLGRIVQHLPLRREPGRMLLVENLVNLAPAMRRLTFGPVQARLEAPPRQYSAWELVFLWNPGPDGVLLNIHHATPLYGEATVQRWGQAYLRILDALIDSEAATPASIRLVDDHALEAFAWVNDAPPPCVADEQPDWTLTQMLEAACDRHAGRVAVRSGAATLDYATLDARTRQLALALRQAGVRPGERIGVSLPRGVDMLLAVLGVLRAGAAYVPLDPAFPESRLVYMAGHAGLSRILVDARTPLPALLAQGRTSLDVATLLRARVPAMALPHPASEALAYVLYTSGSTGQPKGVRITHGNLANFLRSMRARPGFGADDVLCAATTLSFDIAALELYLPLISGGASVIADDAEHRDPAALCRLISRHRCTVFQTTPSMLALMADVGQLEAFKGLRLLVGGEALPAALAQRVRALAAGLWNLYGPTETTVWSSVHQVQAGQTQVPLGLPIARTRLYLLDAALQPVMPGATGEIWIGGAGVADGYLDAAELSAARFLPDPFAGGAARMYRTGDLGRREGDQLLFQGRADDQIKLRGYRIEPGEIEAAAMRVDAVRECVAVVRRDAGDDQVLVLYAVARQGAGAMLAEALRKALIAALPPYMRPHHVLVLESLPKTPNGKIDRHALPAPGAQPASPPTAGEAADAPCSALEADLQQRWSRLLGGTSPGRHEDFFALGGHSLLAVRLFADLARDYGVELPLATLIAHPTIAALAAVLRQAGAGPDQGRTSPLVVPLRAGTRRPALFLVHAVGGNVLNYLPLLHGLPAEQAVYGLQARGLQGQDTPLSSIDDMADLYLRDIRTLQPQGPYLLGGGSMGGIVALEIARRLRAAGAEVSLLVMLDTRAPGAGRGQPDWHAVASALRRPARLGARLRLRLRAAWQALRRRWRRSSDAPETELRLRRVEQAHRQALRDYTPRRYAGDLTLMRSGEPHRLGATLGWQCWVDGEILVRALPGSHEDFIEQPQASQCLRACLDAALKPSAHP
jgi:amino acid adenylation domain-containing protein